MFKKVILAMVFSSSFYGTASAIDNIELTKISDAAGKGDAQAQNKLGQLYEQGQGIPKDYVLAVQWYRKAANQGFANAEGNLGLMYQQGRGVAQSDQDAFKWIKKAAEQNNPRAQLDLASMYMNGKGVIQSNTESINWLQKAADQGFAPAEYSLGLMNYNGRVVPQSYMAAVSWYRKAAAQNFAPADNALGFMSSKGLGMQQDQTEAFNWALKAAELNLPQAEWEVSLMYGKGAGVAQNLDQAKFWHNKAIAAGYVPPTQNLNPSASPAQNTLNSQAAMTARAEQQNKQFDPDRIQKINKAFLANNFHPLKLLQKGQVIYPKDSLANREFGTVIVWPSVNEEGKVTNVTIHRTSGHEALDMAARDAAMHNVYAPYIDPETGEARAVQTELVIDFNLPEMENVPLPSVIPNPPRNPSVQFTTNSNPRPMVSQNMTLNMRSGQLFNESPADYHPLKIIQAGKVVNPSDAEREHEFGKVVLWLTVDAKGKVTDAKVHHTSGFAGLDMAAQFAADQTVYAPFVDPNTGKARATETVLEIDFPRVVPLVQSPAKDVNLVTSDVNLATCLPPEPKALAKIHNIMANINVHDTSDSIGTSVLVAAALNAKYGSNLTFEDVESALRKVITFKTVLNAHNVQVTHHFEYKDPDTGEIEMFDGDKALELYNIQSTLKNLSHDFQGALHKDPSMLLQKPNDSEANVAFNVNAKTNNWSALLFSTDQDVYFLYGNGKVCPISRTSFSQQYSHSFFMVLK